MSMEVVLIHSSSHNCLLELQSFLEKANFTKFFARIKENVKPCTTRIDKKKSKHKKNLENIKSYLVFTRVFNFLGGRPKLTYAFSHSCLPFLGQVMHFYKSPWIVLIDTYCKYLQTFLYIVGY
jgi:hypothetical protein